MKNSQKGQTIIEAIVALMTILLIMTAIAIVVVNGLYNSRFIKNQNEANKYAQQGMEFVRNIQVNDLDTFVGYVNASGPYCIQGNGLTTQNCFDTGVNTGSSYNRTITFSKNDANCIGSGPTNNAVLAVVVVKWSSSKCPASSTFCHKSELHACLPFTYPSSQP